MYQTTTGTGEAADGAVDAEIIAAVTGKVIRVLKGVLTVHVAAAGNAGKAALEDGAGGTRFFEVDADTVGEYQLDFGPTGYPLTAGNALNLTVDEDGATEATATCTVTAYLL
jgi:hypothetical protein